MTMLQSYESSGVLKQVKLPLEFGLHDYLLCEVSWSSEVDDLSDSPHLQ